MRKNLLIINQVSEHTSGLVRQYLPKNKRLDEVSGDLLKVIENLLNNRARKVLDFSTSDEVFNHLSRKASNVTLRS